MLPRRLAIFLGLALLLCGCAQTGASGNPGHALLFPESRHPPVTVDPFCGATNGPATSPPAPPADYSVCFPDGL